MTARLILPVVVCCVVGCGKGPAPQPGVETGTYRDDVYNVEYEYPSGSSGSVSSNQSQRPDGRRVEELTVEVAGRYTLKIADGKVTLNGADRGTVKQGDRIKVTADGKLLVNDAPRE